ncbi:MAG: polysaccharide biosynthesis protein [Bacteroidetes bacterium]|nr:polysaccharide biosynthesis protein [Bacteroidota bacterium]
MERMLITGGTGFLGRALAVKLKNKFEVLICGRNNSQNSFAQMQTGCKAVPMDVARIESVKDIFYSFQPHHVIHAAATKFVDISEKEPFEAIDINVIGSENIARMAIEHQCKTVIGISTDKAAPPVSNTYALTKALMERTFCALDAKTKTHFACVRFGNIAWSSGSVFPIWKKMAAMNKKIETTGSHMRRYLLTVEEAADLVILAHENINEVKGGVLIRDMKALQIEDVLKIFAANSNVPWEKIAPRPGEREDEFLLGETELRYSEKKVFGGITHYLFTPNKISAQPVTEILSTLTAPRFSEEELKMLVKEPENILVQ